MKTRKILVSAFLAVFLSTSVFAHETNPVEKKETTGNEVQKESKESGGGSVKYYGERAGLFRPCVGPCVMVCKEVIGNETTGKAVVTDGVNTIVVDIEKVNFEDGSVDM